MIPINSDLLSYNFQKTNEREMWHKATQILSTLESIQHYGMRFQQFKINGKYFCSSFFMDLINDDHKQYFLGHNHS